MYYTIELTTKQRIELVDITSKVSEIIKKSKVKSGVAIIYIPHTTAAVTINENYDPSVARDINETLTRIIPHHYHYNHSEGNADAHIKSAIIGSSRTVFFENSEIQFGSWQGIFFCEFDGPRKRKAFVKIVPDIEDNI
ncbi:MAG: secondary thiamine-phosphate synthase enzyme YjbQ [candidate division WOR-3 bacterium]|nr:secondary thiamine-phosphate synthase enzyme YjbQ [candidate division WOR-3 bacterium]